MMAAISHDSEGRRLRRRHKLRHLPRVDGGRVHCSVALARRGQNQMLDYTAAPREAWGRLPCQVMHNELDGIAVRSADPQL